MSGRFALIHTLLYVTLVTASAIVMGVDAADDAARCNSFDFEWCRNEGPWQEVGIYLLFLTIAEPVLVVALGWVPALRLRATSTALAPSP